MPSKCNNRNSERHDVSLITFVRKPFSDGSYSLMQFKSKDLSTGGVFLTTDNLSIFELGEECELLLDDQGEKYIETNAKVVRGARVFTESGDQIVSGYGLMFYNPDASFLEIVQKHLR